MYNDITDYFRQLISQTGSYDIARDEFQRHLADDPELEAEYKAWCDDNGYRPRTGFDEYCQQMIDSHDSVWDSLTNEDDY